MFTQKLILKPMTSLEKCFLDEDLSGHPACDRFLMFRNERLSFEVGVYNATPELRTCSRANFTLSGELAPYVTMKQVISVPVQYPTNYVGYDDQLLREKPCLAPDPIRPMHYLGALPVPCGLTQTLWFDVSLPQNFPAGEYPLTVAVAEAEEPTEITVTVRVLDADLPAQKLIHTEWFYTDCIAEAHHVRAFSEKHWRLIESYLRTAAEHGVNMILTPVFTPEIDTAVDGERMTTQLVGITVTGKDRYEFDFSLLGRWIALCRNCGVTYFEIPHFFTQWGAKHAPKFIATVNGRKKRIFGWETDAFGAEYRAFLAQFIPALLAYLKESGVDQNCFFHVSDEPSMKQLEHYKACRELLDTYLGGYPIIDALSDIDFYDSGAIRKPVPAIRKIGDFLGRKIDGLWAYYAGNRKDQTGRCITAPAARTRILGVQLWLANIEGFLHWGYNFYHNQNSYDYVDPFGDTGGEYFTPSGDEFLVYPGTDGTAWASIRLNALREAVDDMRALDLLAARRGRAFAEDLLRETAGGTLDFFHYPKDAAFFAELRARIAKEIEAK